MSEESTSFTLEEKDTILKKGIIRELNRRNFHEKITPRSIDNSIDKKKKRLLKKANETLNAIRLKRMSIHAQKHACINLSFYVDHIIESIEMKEPLFFEACGYSEFCTKDNKKEEDIEEKLYEKEFFNAIDTLASPFKEEVKLFKRSREEWCCIPYNWETIPSDWKTVPSE